MELKLRPKNIDDEEFLLKLYSSTREEELSIVPWTRQEKDAFIQMQFNAQTKYYTQIYPEMEYQIILHDNIPAGRLIIARLSGEIRIVDISIITDQRGLGTGKKLLQEIINEAQSANKKAVLHVEQNNRAQNLYKRMGFNIVSYEGFYFRMEWDPEKKLANVKDISLNENK